MRFLDIAFPMMPKPMNPIFDTYFSFASTVAWRGSPRQAAGLFGFDGNYPQVGSPEVLPDVGAAWAPRDLARAEGGWLLFSIGHQVFQDCSREADYDACLMRVPRLFGAGGNPDVIDARVAVLDEQFVIGRESSAAPGFVRSASKEVDCHEVQVGSTGVLQ